MASGWNLWVWLVSGVVRRYMYYRYPHNNYYFPATPLVLTLFFGSIIPISLFIFKCFFCTLDIRSAQMPPAECIIFC